MDDEFDILRNFGKIQSFLLINFDSFLSNSNEDIMDRFTAKNALQVTNNKIVNIFVPPIPLK